MTRTKPSKLTPEITLAKLCPLIALESIVIENHLDQKISK